MDHCHTHLQGRGGPRRGEGRGSGGGNTTLLTSTEGKLAVSKRQLESFKTPKFSTRDRASIQAHKAQRFHYISIHTDIHNAVRFGSEEAEVLILFKAHLHHARYRYSLHA